MYQEKFGADGTLCIPKRFEKGNEINGFYATKIKVNVWDSGMTPKKNRQKFEKN